MYAGFWKRFAALIIDNILVNILMGIFMVLIGYDFTGQSEPQISKILPIMFFAVAATFLYWPLFESSSLQATPGKLALGIKVTDLSGGRVGFWTSFGRNLGKIISGLTLNIGYAMAGFTVRKQALHDKMSGCLVIDKNASPEDLAPLPPAKPWFICLAIFGTLLPYIIMFLAGLFVAMFAFKYASSAADLQSLGNRVTTVNPENSKDEFAEAKRMDDLLSLIANFQNVYADNHEGNYASDFAQLEAAIPGFPNQSTEVGSYHIALNNDYVTAERKGDNVIPDYVLTKCYKKNRTCIYSENISFAAGADFPFGNPEICCFD